MTDKQRGGGEREGAEAAPASSVGAQQSNIAAKALIMSPDSAVPLPPILPLACELDPRGGEGGDGGGGKHGIIARRGGRPLEQASHFSPHSMACVLRGLLRTP